MTALASIAVIAIRSASAQIVRGVVVAEAAGAPAAPAAPVSSVAVVLLDSAGLRLTGTLSDDSGRFAVRAPTPGRFSLRTERIGYRSITSAAFDIRAGETVAQRLAIPAAPVTFAPITVAAASRCTVHPQEGTVVAQYWDEARKALSATMIAQRERLLRFSAVRIERDLTPNGNRVIREETSPDSGVYFTPYVSLPAEELAARGYAHLDRGDVKYWAPDPEVLLSNRFASDHCFRVQTADDEHRGFVGIAFEPASQPRSRSHIEIRGVLWIDLRTSELRSLDFHYTPPPAGTPVDRLGGHVEFKRLANNTWMIPRWRLQLPVLGIDMTQRRIDPLSRPGDIPLLVAVREIGGDVTSVRTLAGESLERPELPPANLSGVIFDSTRGTPLAGAAVMLEGTRHQVVTDSSGRFAMSVALEGNYRLTILHPQLESMGYAPRFDVTLASGRSSVLTASVPTVATMLAAACPEWTDSLAASMVTGVVRDRASGQVVPDASVSIAWPMTGAQSADRSLGRGSPAPRIREIVTDSTGRYRLCGVPGGASLTLRAVTADGRAALVTTQISPRDLAVRDVELEAAQSDAARAARSRADATAPPRPAKPDKAARPPTSRE
ncbi:MAG: carboxypeptidase regulatory-like domain-containing protein [Gemmatimonadota bacterium]|nr:carboxypeptidase regulatory-like domain-containing protein [Gemmatimonadota bacterium]